MDPSTLTAPTPQDTCHYSLSLPLPSGSLPALIPELLTFVSSLSSSYIWHKQPFNLSLSPLSFSPTTTADTQYLEGKTDCTDCVDDEWFIVWILRELSKNYEGLVVGIKDEDGEFLLIEAAEVLPRWVTPNNATNRVSPMMFDIEREADGGVGVDTWRTVTSCWDRAFVGTSV
jgi:hypothetical protein